MPPTPRCDCSGPIVFCIQLAKLNEGNDIQTHPQAPHPTLLYLLSVYSTSSIILCIRRGQAPSVYGYQNLIRGGWVRATPPVYITAALLNQGTVRQHQFPSQLFGFTQEIVLDSIHAKDDMP